MAKRKGAESWKIPTENEINQSYGTKDDIFDSATKITKTQYEIDQQKKQMYTFLTILIAVIIVAIGIFMLVFLINAKHKINVTNDYFKSYSNAITEGDVVEDVSESNNLNQSQMAPITGNPTIPQQPTENQVVPPTLNQYPQSTEGIVTVPQGQPIQNPINQQPTIPQGQPVPNNMQTPQIPNQGEY